MVRCRAGISIRANYCLNTELKQRTIPFSKVRRQLLGMDSQA
jgi:hypothetical protein